MDHFAEIRSLLQSSPWDQNTHNALFEHTRALQEQEPILWMSQVAPYIASFQDKWDKYPYIARTAADALLVVSLLPCITLTYMPQRFHLTLEKLPKPRITSLDYTYSLRPPNWRNVNTFTHCTYLKLGERALPPIIEVTPLEHITHLDLSGCNLDSDMLLALVSTGLFTNIKHLNLSNNPLPDDLPHISTINTTIR